MKRLYVNPFWFGVLITLVGFVVFLIIFALVASRNAEANEEEEQEEFQEILKNLTGKTFKIGMENGFLVAEPVEESDEEKAD